MTNFNKSSYQAILPEHQAFLSPVLNEQRDDRTSRFKWGAAIGIVLLLVASWNNNRTTASSRTSAVGSASAQTTELGKVAQEISLSPERSSAAASFQLSLDAQMDRMEEWKQEIHRAWGPFWNDTKEHWDGFKEGFGEDEHDAEEKSKVWWAQFSAASKEEWNETTTHTSHWWDIFSHKSQDFWNETETKSDGWWDDARFKSSEWWDDVKAWFKKEEHKSSGWWNNTEEWVEDEKHKGGGWWNHTEEWVEDEKHKGGGWWNHTEEWVEDEKHKGGGWWNHTEEWVDDEGHKSDGWWNHTKDWFEDQEDKSNELWNTTEHKSADWFGDEENRTAEWWNKTEHKSGAWFNNEEDNVEHWFNSTENKTSNWFHHADDWIKHQTEKGENWWNASEHKVEDWWYNETHHTKDMAEFVIYMNSTAAYRMLTTGSMGFIDYAQDYFLIQQGLDAQMNQAYCPVATSAAIVNSFRGSVELPVDPLYDPYHYATQPDLFNDCTNANVIHRNASYDGIFAAPGGLGMPQTKALLECHFDSSVWNITSHHLDPTLITMDDFRQDMQEALANPDARVMINYYRKAVGQAGGGHWSPIGAYSPDMDAFLVMDVAKYKYPNAWISTSLLYKSLQTFDTCGQWKFPMAQEKLHPEYLHPESSFDMMNAMAKLGCESTRRGYITIAKIPVDDDSAK